MVSNLKIRKLSINLLEVPMKPSQIIWKQPFDTDFMDGKLFFVTNQG